MVMVVDMFLRANKQDGGSVTAMKTGLRYSPMDVVGFTSKQQKECTGYNPCER